MRMVFVLPVLSLSLIAGCGGSKRSLGDPKSPTASQQQAATGLTGSITQVQENSTKPEQGPALAGSLYSIGGNATAGNLKQGLDYLTKDFTDPGCVTKSGNTTTYNNCMNSGDSAKVNGSVTITGDLTNLTVSYNKLTISGFGGSGATGNLILDGSVTVTSTMIDGTLTTTLDATVSGTGGAGAKTVVVVDYNAVTYAQGCITGGAIRVDYDIKIATVGGIGVGAGNTGGSALFEWTACNTFTVRNS